MPDQITAMKRDLAIRAIEFWVWEKADEGRYCLQGAASLGFEFATDHEPSAHLDAAMHPLYHYRYPPVDVAQAGPRPIVVGYESPEDDGTLQGATQDVWSAHYQPWFEAVEDVFEGWDALPEERDFWSIADHLEASANPIEIDMQASSNTRVVGNTELSRSFNQLWHARYPMLHNPPTQSPRVGPVGHSRAVDVFYDTYAAGLDLVIGQQALLLNILAAAAREEGDLWQRARVTVMEIGHAAVDAMGPEHLTEADVAAAINVVGDLMNLGGLFPGTPVAAFSGIVGLLCDGLGLYWSANPPPKPTRIDQTLAGATPDTVLGKIRAALAELNRQIVDEELALRQLLAAALEETYTPAVRSGVAVSLPPPGLLGVTDPAQVVDSIDMDFTEIRRASAAMDDIASRMSVVPVGLDRFAASSPWLRAPHVGVNSTGPHAAWASLLARSMDVIADTASELNAAAEHLTLAVDAIERADDTSRAAFQRHLTDIADVRAPEPTPPAPRDHVPGGAMP